MPSSVLTVMVSSTVIDLPEHRPEIMRACLEKNMQPLLMESLPPNDDDAIAASLKLVDAADVYLGVFAHRYGYVPKRKNRRQISITQMEYERAVERKIPRLIFIIHENHSIVIEQVEWGLGKEKLDSLKERLKVDNGCKFFKSAQELHAQAGHGLAELQHKYLQSVSQAAATSVFVAHGKYEWEKFTAPLVERLRAANFMVWAGRDQVNESQLNQVLDLSGWVVVCASPSAVKLKSVAEQVEYFVASRKQVAVVVCRESALPWDIGEDRVFPYSKDGIDALIKLIKQLQEQAPFAKYES